MKIENIDTTLEEIQDLGDQMRQINEAVAQVGVRVCACRALYSAFLARRTSRLQHAFALLLPPRHHSILSALTVVFRITPPPPKNSPSACLRTWTRTPWPTSWQSWSR
jgi:hypothetical protein